MLPVKFRKSNENLINYDYTDIASGLGYQTFYPFVSYVLNTPSYHLSNVQCFSGIQQITNGTTDFLTTAFNLPRVLKGDVYLDIYGHSNAGTWSCSGSVILVHGDGTADTTLGTFDAKTFAAVNSVPATCKMAVSQTQIKRGDQIKLEIKLNSTDNYVYIDPSGAWSIAQTTKLRLPFKIMT